MTTKLSQTDALDQIIAQAEALKKEDPALWKEKDIRDKLKKSAELLQDMASGVVIAFKKLADEKRAKKEKDAQKKKQLREDAEDAQLPMAYKLGESVGDKGVYMGSGYVRYKDSIVGAFNFFAAPRDLHHPYVVSYPSINYYKETELTVSGGFNAIVAEMKKLEKADGQGVKLYRSADGFSADVAAGTYNGEYFIPDRALFERMLTTNPDLRRNEDYVTANENGENVLVYSTRKNEFHTIGKQRYEEYQGDGCGPPGGGYYDVYNEAKVRLVRAEPVKL